MKTLRLVHLYLGTFLAPAIFFFALTGALQTFNLHESERGSSYQPPAWIVRLAQIHKKQSIQAPPQRNVVTPPQKPAAAAGPALNEMPSRAAGTVAATPNDSPRPAASPGRRPLRVSWPLKWFFLLVSVGLATTTLLGIVMSFQRRRSPLLLCGLLIAGIVIPIGLAFL
jgi:hypothetical protein